MVIIYLTVSSIILGEIELMNALYFICYAPNVPTERKMQFCFS